MSIAHQKRVARVFVELEAVFPGLKMDELEEMLCEPTNSGSLMDLETLLREVHNLQFSAKRSWWQRLFNF